ncbi:MAG TPA: winged helix-turn-helix domain-containing protein [Candidatus Acidoferrum sp.]|nr:winged helix-turn-helix domain-containing protein [Candidatus Acidoferrum sp.]
MSATLGSLADPGPLQPELEILLRRAATHCWLERLKEQGSEGVYTVGDEQIGQTAGAVWQTLYQQGPLTFAALMEEVNAPQSLFFMAIGWLSREHKLKIEPAGGDYVVDLT